MTRLRFLLTTLVISFVCLGMNLSAGPVQKEETVEGTVIRAGNAKLTLMASSNGSIQRFFVAADAIISRDSSYVNLEEVRYGDFALVSVKKNEDAPVATVIVALSPFKGDREHR